jgi:heat-inducible transcriptional repressor
MSEMLTEREKAVLLAVLESYIESAEPTGSRTIAKHYRLGVSAATVRNTMADLEAKGFLTHPHTSAGRVPTDMAYRYYVDELMGHRPLSAVQQVRIERELTAGQASAIEELIARAASVLSLLTGELGLAIGPALSEAVLQRLDLVPVDSEKILLVFTLESGVVRTVYVDLKSGLPRQTLSSLASLLNERLAGSTLTAIQSTLGDRLRDIDAGAAGDLINIFVESGPDIFDWVATNRRVHLGSASTLADQPEFTTKEGLRQLIELTEQRELLASLLGRRAQAAGPQITIGTEHETPELLDLTVVTANYAVGHLHGVVGVIGPTRMPYDKVVAVVDCTSSLVSRLMQH